MIIKYNKICIISILVIIVSNLNSFAQDEEYSVIKSGSKQIETSVILINDNNVSIQNATLSVINKPKIIKNIRIKPRLITNLKPNERKEFKIKFDIDSNAKPGTKGILKFQIKSFEKDIHYDIPQPEIKLKIDDSAFVDVPQKLYLLSVTPSDSTNIKWKKGYTGVEERISGTEFSQITNSCVKYLPLEIEPNKSFSINYETHTRVEHAEGHRCKTKTGTSPNNLISLLQIKNNDTTLKLKGTKDLDSYCDSGLIEDADNPFKEVTSKSDRTNANLNFTPTGEKPYEYVIDTKLYSGKFETKFGTPKISIVEGKQNFNIEIPGKLTLTYGIPSGNQKPIKTKALCMKTSELNKTKKGGGSLRYKYGYHAMIISGVGFENEGYRKQGKSSWGIERLLVTQNTNKLRKEIYNKLKSWECESGEMTGIPRYWDTLSVTSKGPFNSKAKAKSASVKSKWKKVGSKFYSSEQLKQKYCGGTDTHTDSANTLVKVPNLIGLSSGKAKTQLSAVGLTAKILSGSPAPTSSKFGIVQSQKPKAGTKLPEDSTVEIMVYSKKVDVNKEKEKNQEACSRKWPGSIAYWNSQTQKYECDCPSGENWNLAMTKCISRKESAQEKCDSNYPGSGTYAVWNEVEKAYKCRCPSGTEWDRNYTQCIKIKSEKEKNQEVCSRKWPGSVASWNSQTQKYECDCPSGENWNLAMTKCISRKESAQEKCDSNYPGSGTYAIWNEAEKAYKCRCPSGTDWNRNYTQCIKIKSEKERNQEVCSRKWSGSIAYWNSQTQKYECDCPSGTTWNSNNTKCISIKAANQEVCSNRWPGSVAYWNSQKRKYECDCPVGKNWNSAGTKCVRAQTQTSPPPPSRRPGGGSDNIACPCKDSYGNRYRNIYGLSDCPSPNEIASETLWIRCD